MPNDNSSNKPGDALRDLQDRVEITDVINRYGLGVKKGDADLLASCFSDDARLEYGFIDVDGVENVRAFFNGTLPGVGDGRSSTMGLETRAASTPVMTNIMIDLDGDKAHCESLCLAIHAGTNGGEERVVVRGTTNSDDFVRTASGWKIKRRVHGAVWKFDTPGSILHGH